MPISRIPGPSFDGQSGCESVGDAECLLALIDSGSERYCLVTSTDDDGLGSERTPALAAAWRRSKLSCGLFNGSGCKTNVARS
jgi:hypothetical protein